MALTQRESTTKLNDIKAQQKANTVIKTANADGTPKFTQVSSKGGGGGGGSSSSNINSGYNFNQADYLKQMSTGINSLYDNQTQARLAQLRSSQQKALGQINQQKAEVKPMYADKRNQSDVVSNQNVQKLRELMASNGLQASGENVTANVGLQNARQSALNGLNLQEQQTMNDFNRQINDVTDPSQEQALINSLEAQRAQALLDAGIRADDRGYQVGRDNVTDNQWNTQFNFNKDVDSRNYQYQAYRDTKLDGRYDDQFAYQQDRDKIGDARWQTEFDYGKSVDDRDYNYQVGRDKVGDKQAADQLALQKAQFKSDKEWREYTFNNMSASEKASMEWAREQYGEEAAWRMYEMEYNGNVALSQNQAEIDAYSGNALDFLP